MAQLTTDNALRFAATLRTWAAYGHSLHPVVANQTPDWESAQRLILAASGLFHEQAEQLRVLLAESNRRLGPLSDPLTEDFGTHRWLAADREEAYSDWLEWIVRRIESHKTIFRLFGVTADCSEWGTCPVTVGRELPVPFGHVEKRGRLDLWIRVGERALVVVEIKKFGADQSDTAKHVGYGRWINDQREQMKDRILIAASGSETSYDGFRLLTWDRLCAGLRALVPELCAHGKVVVAAMVLAFVGAVEQNLLGYSISTVRNIVSGRAVTFDTRIVDYLQQSLAMQEP